MQCRRSQFNSWVGICWRRDRLPTPVFLGFSCGSAGKESTCNAGDLGSIPGLRRSPEGKGYPLQYSGLENSMDKPTGSQTVGNDWGTFTFSGDKGAVSLTYLKRKLLVDMFEEITQNTQRKEMENMAGNLRGQIEWQVIW